MLKPAKPSTRKYRIATYNAMLHQRSICPGNHHVEYANGWYYFDGDPRRNPRVTRRAKELEEDPTVEVFYSEGYNTYVLAPVFSFEGAAYPEQGAIRV